MVSVTVGRSDLCMQLPARPRVWANRQIFSSADIALMPPQPAIRLPRPPHLASLN